MTKRPPQKNPPRATGEERMDVAALMDLLDRNRASRHDKSQNPEAAKASEAASERLKAAAEQLERTRPHSAHDVIETIEDDVTQDDEGLAFEYPDTLDAPSTMPRFVTGILVLVAGIIAMLAIVFVNSDKQPGTPIDLITNTLPGIKSPKDAISAAPAATQPRDVHQAPPAGQDAQAEAALTPAAAPQAMEPEATPAPEPAAEAAVPELPPSIAPDAPAVNGALGDSDSQELLQLLKK